MHAKLTLLSLSLVLAPTGLAQVVKPPTFPPPVPTQWPAWDELHEMAPQYLLDPLITESVAYINAVVPKELLALQPSRNNSVVPAQPTYMNDKEKYKWWTDPKHYTAVDDIIKCPNENEWGITYDDGPSVNIVNGVHTFDTAHIRATLKTLDLKATFFVKGGPASGPNGRAEVEATMAEGHEIAMHTWSHAAMTTLTNEQVVAQLKYTEALIYSYTGKVPVLWRPPYGDVDDRVRAIARALGYRTVIWSANPPRDSGDASGRNDPVATVVNTIQSWFVKGPGVISLQHDVNPYTSEIAVKALEEIGKAGPALGLKIMPVGTCTGVVPYREQAVDPKTDVTGGTGPAPTTTAGATKGTTPTATAPGTGIKPTAPVTQDNKKNQGTAGSVMWTGLLSAVAGVLAMVF
ncbi:chitin deacetylase [Gaertneriomyces sp. JEL0708]|nr:chitin deacetylase [Gaertneriomyces sp. JEL0708]